MKIKQPIFHHQSQLLMQFVIKHWIEFWKSSTHVCLYVITKRQEHFSSLSGKSPKRNLANQWRHCRSFKDSWTLLITFYELAMRCSLFRSLLIFNFWKTMQSVFFLLIDSWIFNSQIKIIIKPTLNETWN